MGGRGGPELPELERGELSVAGVRRSFWLARAARPATGPPVPPLLIVLHGPGMDGRDMARFTGLARRGPAAGITVAFPDGWRGAWHPFRPPDAEPDLDDTRFLAELATHVEGLGAASSWPVFLAGLATGARYAEHVARHGLLPVAGLFLVAGTGLAASRRLAPVPQLRASMTLVLGTGDRTTPYEGGRLIRRGIIGRVQRRRAARHGELPGEDVVTGAEQLLADWAAANGMTAGGMTAGGRTGGTMAGGGGLARPEVTELPAQPGELPVTRTTLSHPGSHPVTLYRVDGGGHGWPGGCQPLPSPVTGAPAPQLDATGLLLAMTERETALAAGHPARGHQALGLASRQRGPMITEPAPGLTGGPR